MRRGVYVNDELRGEGLGSRQERAAEEWRDVHGHRDPAAEVRLPRAPDPTESLQTAEFIADRGGIDGLRDADEGRAPRAAIRFMDAGWWRHNGARWKSYFAAYTAAYERRSKAAA